MRTWKYVFSLVVLAASTLGDGFLAVSQQTPTAPDTNNAVLIRALDAPRTQAVAFSPDGKALAFLTFTGGLTLLDVKTGNVIWDKDGGIGGNAIAFSPDGKIIATGGYNGPTAIGGKIVLQNDAGSLITLWDAATGAILRGIRIPVKYPQREDFPVVHSLAFSPDSQTLVGGVAIQIGQSQEPPFFDDIDTYEIRFWDINTGKIGRTLSSGPTYHVVFSSNGRLLATASSKFAIIWNIETGQPLHKIEPEVIPRQGYWEICSVDFSPDDETLAIAFRKGYRGDTFTKRPITLWNVKTGTLQKSLPGHDADVTGLVFSRDGKLLISGSADETLRIWHAENGALLQSLVGQKGEFLRSLALSPDGKTLVSAREDGAGNGTICLWNMTSYFQQ